jgi:hypothetical protein
VSIYKLLPSAQLAIIPNSDHIIFYRQPALMETIVTGFVEVAFAVQAYDAISPL